MWYGCVVPQMTGQTVQPLESALSSSSSQGKAPAPSVESFSISNPHLLASLQFPYSFTSSVSSGELPSLR